MSSFALLRTSLRSARPVVQQLARPSTLAVRHSSHAAAEDYESFNKRYADFFAQTNDLFELQRGLNNCFAYDLVPSQEVVEEAIKAARRVNDYSTAVRIFEGLKEKTENESQYQSYVAETAALRKDLGILLKEELYH
ncbi:Cytochrome c oxidase subunit 6 [Microbotryomycetes sp. JL201]|nr:Cytochrome c oxidase subunit 6 [Microbotryomycetes sp. JL201]